MKYLSLIWAGLWRAPLRTALTGGTLAVAFLLFGLLEGLNQGMSNVVSNLNDRTYTTSRTSATPLQLEQLSKIRSVRGVETVAHLTFIGGYYQDRRNTLPVFATHATELFGVYSSLFEVSAADVNKLENTRTGAIVARGLAARFGWKVGDRVPIKSFLYPRPGKRDDYAFEIVGLFSDRTGAQTGVSGGMIVNYSYFDEARATGKRTVHVFVSRVSDPYRITEICAAIDQLFENSSHETSTKPESGLLQAQISQIGNLDFIVNSILASMLFSLLFVTSTTMMQSVRERRAEFAVLKSVGFTDTAVVVLVVSEALLLCLVSALIGILAATPVLTGLVGALGSTFMTPALVGFGIAIAIVIAAVSVAVPAWSARRLTIVQALNRR